VSVILLVLGRSCVGVMGFGVVALECGCVRVGGGAGLLLVGF